MAMTEEAVCNDPMSPVPTRTWTAADQALMNDPWAHRSEGMHCRTCMWFIEKIGGTSGIGRCRRHAPTMNGYPVVFRHDWCGDHKLDETKAA